MISILREHRLFALLLAAFLVLAVIYSIVTPIFEAGDEIWHYPYVQHLATEHSLIVQDPAIKTLWSQEGGQAPLYYMVSALATAWIDTSDLSDRLWINPHAAIGIPLLFGNKNMIVHTAAESFPWHNTTLAIHLIRFLSIVFSAGTIVFTYLLALEIGKLKMANEENGMQAHFRHLHLMPVFAAGFVAFNPMFIFISASVNNDSLAALLAAFALWLMARMINARSIGYSSFISLGMVLGLAAITKVSDLGLILVAALVFIFLSRKMWKPGTDARPLEHNDLRSAAFLTVLIKFGLCAVLVAAIGAWWYVRNYLLYGDPFAFNIWVAIAGGRAVPATLLSLLGEFQGLRISFWGNFGGVNIIAPEWVYQFLDATTVLAALGILAGAVRRTLPGVLALPVFWLLLIFSALVRWTLLTFASQGRLLFPAISAIGVLLAYGLGELIALLSIRERLGNYMLPAIPLGFLLIFSALTPFFLITPTYALPQRMAPNASVPNPIHILFDDQVELVGYNMPQKVMTGSELAITLYWRGLKPIDEDLSVYIHLFDANGRAIGQWDSFTGNGLYPTRFWQANVILVDNYRVPVSADESAPRVGRVEVGLYHLATMINLVARDPQGRTITPSIARFKLPGRMEVRVENSISRNFGDQISLIGFGMDERTTPGSTLNLRLDWRALATMDEDYSVFVHIIDPKGQLIAQKDDQPSGGAYPTSFWDLGETVADAYVIEIPGDTPSGDYHVRVGIYRQSDGSRLISSDADGVDLGVVRIAR